MPQKKHPMVSDDYTDLERRAARLRAETTRRALVHFGDWVSRKINGK